MTIADYFLKIEFFKNLVESLSQSTGMDVAAIFYVLIIVTFCLLFTVFLATVGGFGTFAERKVSADLQARIGPNRVGPYGILQLLADGIKMISKENIVPRDADKFLFYLAPLLSLFGVFSTFAVFPFSKGLTLSHLNVGVFYLLAISSLVGVGVFLGGYSSNSKWSMLGGMRGASQIISYEIPVTLSIMAIVLISGGLSFDKVIGGQSALPHNWYIFHNPFTFIGFFVLFVGMLAETNRAPFDLPEAESELVSGYHTEYTGIRFGLFALAEYVEIFIVSGVAVSLFLGGYRIPFPFLEDMLPGQILQFGTLFIKTCVLYYVVIWIRWTFPRLRVDQLMSVCWKYLTPMAIFNLVGCAIWVVAFDGKSIVDLIFH
jgi:NADH-quinone oxidoreductase subunit H